MAEGIIFGPFLLLELRFCRLVGLLLLLLALVLSDGSSFVILVMAWVDEPEPEPLPLSISWKNGMPLIVPCLLHSM